MYPTPAQMNILQSRFEKLGLTLRRSQVAAQYVAGYKKREISKNLSIQPSTVRQSLYNTCVKLGCNLRSLHLQVMDIKQLRKFLKSYANKKN